ncbi:hypothetical protein [Sulfitobacter sabulilitoris]|uniref:Heme utilization protein n=1 Tax=Sulfitobacter sabulilitoris TaxID=2562655 RepID=A0A5S3PLL6_9RHOB|nr:hypothetical protein [Sulfitobacter sabulilitoris]TMM55314.1 hypothetical protein FDT80_07110 [Sulfitobacter sabulilitoris]
MKLITTTIAATLLSTAAFADNSDRYNDLRLDTSNAATVYADGEQPKADADASTFYNDLRLNTSDAETSEDGVTFSTRSDASARTSGEGYIYGGFGDGNDSR